MRVPTRRAPGPRVLVTRRSATRVPAAVGSYEDTLFATFDFAAANTGGVDALPPLEATVSIREDARYDCRESVERWRYHDVDASAAGIGAALRNEPAAAGYFAYHGFRSSALASQALVALLLAIVLGKARRGSVGVTRFLTDVLQDLPSSGKLLGYEIVGTLNDDYAHIRRGTYKAPWDMSLRHRQLAPSFVLPQAAATIRESMRVLQGRGARSAGQDVETRNWLQSPLYPGYFTDSFHFQTDGWLSKSSAEVYEMSTETIFQGRQDAMQRSALVPIQRWRVEGRGGGVEGHGISMIDLACGTGRFATFLRDNMPAADTTLLDLSPFYLEKARENHRYFERFRGRGRISGRVDYVHAPAEASGLPSSTFDVVNCMYLFHEIPRDVRAAVAKEMVRLARPGAIIVLTDSTQLGDRPEMDEQLGSFTDFNEPHYVDYILDDIGAHFEAAGAVPYEKSMCSMTKTLSFLKPDAVEA